MTRAAIVVMFLALAGCKDEPHWETPCAEYKTVLIPMYSPVLKMTTLQPVPRCAARAPKRCVWREETVDPERCYERKY